MINTKDESPLKEKKKRSHLITGRLLNNNTRINQNVKQSVMKLTFYEAALYYTNTSLNIF
jgi:hypothetical protein